LNLVDRWLRGAQHKRASQAHSFEGLAHDARVEGAHIGIDIREFGHSKDRVRAENRRASIRSIILENRFVNHCLC
jgi:hypothetical protein